MAGEAGRAQQQENGRDTWVMVTFPDPCQVGADRTWVARDRRKDLKTSFHVTVSSRLCVLTVSLANVFSFPFPCTQVSEQGPMGPSTKAPRSSSRLLAPSSMWVSGHVGERAAPPSHPGFLAAPGPELTPREGRGWGMSGVAKGTPVLWAFPGRAGGRAGMSGCGAGTGRPT